MNPKQITLGDGRRITLQRVETPNDLHVPLDGEPFVALIWGCVEWFDASHRREVAKALIEAGCRYIVCGGVDCERWHDDADIAWEELLVERGSDREMPAVMTTWLTDDPEEEVVYWAFNLTNFDEHNFRKYLVVMIGHDDSSQRRLEDLIAAVSR